MKIAHSKLANHRVLSLFKLETDYMPGISPAFGTTMKEAAEVCLKHLNHPTYVSFKMNEYTNSISLEWTFPSNQQLNCYDELSFTVELGAYGLAILLMSDLLDYSIIRRSRKGTGFDYWMGKEDKSGVNIFKDFAALEVSGILSGDNNSIQQRVSQKLKQTRSCSREIEVFIVIVEFAHPQARVLKNEKS